MCGHVCVACEFMYGVCMACGYEDYQIIIKFNILSVLYADAGNLCPLSKIFSCDNFSK